MKTTSRSILIEREKIESSSLLLEMEHLLLEASEAKTRCRRFQKRLEMRTIVHLSSFEIIFIRFRYICYFIHEYDLKYFSYKHYASYTQSKTLQIVLQHLLHELIFPYWQRVVNPQPFVIGNLRTLHATYPWPITIFRANSHILRPSVRVKVNLESNKLRNR